MKPLTAEEAQIRAELRTQIQMLAGTIGGRSVGKYEGLRAAAEYIEGMLSATGLSVNRQTFRSAGREVWNIEAEQRGTAEPNEIVVIGAHYDSAAGLPGANDNASGVAAMLNIAQRFRTLRPKRTVRWLAFVNEEPPFFQGPEMGSVVYAARCKQRNEKVVAMLSLETIGYYSDAPNSQRYPLSIHPGYPNTGNYIGFVSNPSSVWLLRKCLKSFRHATDFPCEGLAAPAGITGVGWSDQWSFWQQGYHGLMVTDTAPFRYPYYHTAEDTPDKIDYDGTARVVFGLSKIVEDLAADA